MRKFAAVGKGALTRVTPSEYGERGGEEEEGGRWWNNEFQNISRNSKLFTLKFVHRDRVQIFRK